MKFENRGDITVIDYEDTLRLRGYIYRRIAIAEIYTLMKASCLAKKILKNFMRLLFFSFQ